jgi:death-on-curing protein
VSEPVWLDLDIVVEIHQRQLARYGGASGLRDLGLLDSALARPKWLHEYGAESDLHGFAAAYGFGIIKNHPFVDGNKRVGFLTAYVFLRLNGWHIVADQHDVERVIQAVAGGDLSEDQFARWLKEISEPTEVQRPS